MVPGHWQLLILLSIVVFLFGPALVKILRRLSGGAGDGRPSRPARRAVDGHSHCPHCGAENPARAKYCCACGKPLDFVDV